MKAVIKTPEKEFIFEVELHLAKNPKELRMDPIEFYQKYAKIPQGDHYELALIKLPAEIDLVQEKIHIHQTLKQELFLCWTQAVPTKEKAEFILRLWCIGSVYTILTNQDFVNYLSSCGNDSEKFEEKLKEEFGIQLKEITD